MKCLYLLRTIVMKGEWYKIQYKNIFLMEEIKIGKNDN